MSWNDERVEQLRKLWMEGHSASQIAAELANGITRNAVIGKVHRLGLSGRAKAPAPAPARPRVKPAASAARPSIGGSGGGARPSSRGGMIDAGAPMTMIRGANALALQPTAMSAPTPAPRPIEDVVVPISERVTIMELRESMCRWPLGDPTTPEFRFCGANSPIGEGPYCAYHATIAYQPAQDRRRDRSKAPRI